MRSVRLHLPTVLLIPVAILLCSPSHGFAFENDLHYGAKFHLAFAMGWSWYEAHMIASSDEGVDRDPKTAPALQTVPDFGVVDLFTHPLEQTFQMYQFHCFSRSDDKLAGSINQINQDVLRNLAELEKEAKDAIIAARELSRHPEGRPAAEITKANHAALFYIGQYLHCQEDSWSHSGYGGVDTGHTGDDHFPDSPNWRPEKTQQALIESFRKLDAFFLLWKGRSSQLQIAEVQQLINALKHPKMNGKTQQVRLGCNKILAEHWLYLTLLRQKDLLRTVPTANIKALESPPYSEPECNEVYEEIFSHTPQELSLLKLVEEPRGEYPESRMRREPDFKAAIPYGLRNSASIPIGLVSIEWSDSAPIKLIDAIKTSQERLVRTPVFKADGTLVTLKETARFNHNLVNATAIERITRNGKGCLHKIQVEVKNDGPSVSPEAVLLAAVIFRDTMRPGIGRNMNLPSLDEGTEIQLSTAFESAYPCQPGNTYYVNVQPPRGHSPMEGWYEADVSNNSRDSWTGFVKSPSKINFFDTLAVLASALVGIFLIGFGLHFYSSAKLWGHKTELLFLFLALIMGLQWILYGFSITFGPDQGGLYGSLGWMALQGMGNEPNLAYQANIPHHVFMFYQTMYVVMTALLIAIALAERIKLSVFLAFIILWVTLVQNFLMHWLWGSGGWLRLFGALDFAGGAVLHLLSGVSVLTAVWIVGERLEWESQNVPKRRQTQWAAVFIAGGWLAFVQGNSIATGGFSTSASFSAMAAITAAGLAWFILERRSADWFVNITAGALTGIVAIMPASGFVHPIAAFVIGLFAALFCHIAIAWWPFVNDRILRLALIQVVAASWGLLATGLFASSNINPDSANGLIFGNPSQLGIQAVALLVSALFGGIGTAVILKGLDWILGLRPAPITENGLNIYITNEGSSSAGAGSTAGAGT